MSQSARPLTMTGTLALLLVALVAVAIPHPANADTLSVAPSQEPMISSYCEENKPSLACGIVDFSMPCSQVVNAYTWLDGTCCSLQDRDGGNSCRLRVDGRLAFCSYKLKDTNSYIQHHMSDINTGTCPPSKYTIPFQTHSTPAPSPGTPSVSGNCTTDTADKNCGINVFAKPCWKVKKLSIWSGTCCSLSDTKSGGCKLTVDGPGSECTWANDSEENSFTVKITSDNHSKCPKSKYDLLGETNLSQYQICWASVFRDCAVAAGCTNSNHFPNMFQRCQAMDAGKAAVCVNQATKECNHVLGRPIPTVCNALPALKAGGNLKPRFCNILKGKCGDLAPPGLRCN